MLIRHPIWDFFAPVKSTGRGVPPTHVHQSPTIIAVSVFYPSNARINPITQQLIGETRAGFTKISTNSHLYVIGFHHDGCSYNYCSILH